VLKIPLFAPLPLCVFALRFTAIGKDGGGSPFAKIATPLAEQSAGMSLFFAKSATK
jgi:hypothetical protein